MNLSNKRRIKSIFVLGIFVGLMLGLYTAFVPIFSVEARNLQQDSVVQFNTSTLSEEEGDNDTVVNLVVQISPLPTSPTVVTVTYSTGNGTALSGFDYTAVTDQVITFTADSSATTNIPITILADDDFEEAENFFVQLKNAENANLGANSVMVITIPENDPLNTATPTQSAATPIYIDVYEGNDTIQTAYSLDTVNSGNCVVENATFWPAGDVDYYRFWAQASAEYTLTSTDLSAGLDTILTLYNPEGEQTQQNDDSSPGARNSTITFTPSRDAWYYFSLINEDPSNPAGKTYCVEISESSPTVTPSPTIQPTFAPSSANDACATAVGFT
ncbi:MAG: Calx-beta domain-containing protein, partial [Chloroflexota bacterium]